MPHRCFSAPFALTTRSELYRTAGWPVRASQEHAIVAARAVSAFSPPTVGYPRRGRVCDVLPTMVLFRNASIRGWSRASAVWLRG